MALETMEPAEVATDSTSTPAPSSAGKAFALLNVFLASAEPVLGVSEIARRAGVAKSTAHRLLIVLEENEMVERYGEQWRLGAHLFRLGNAVPMCRPRRLRDRALPYMHDLHQQTRACVQLAVPHGHEVLYVEKVFGHGDNSTPSYVGGTLPMTCTGVGKAMLAHSKPSLIEEVLAAPLPRMTARSICAPERLREELESIRHAGYALDLQEVRPQLVCVAAPIMRGRTCIGAMSVSAIAQRGNPKVWAERLLSATQALSGRA